MILVSINNSDMPITLPSKKFGITFSPEEWLFIEPEEVRYKSNNKKRSIQNSRICRVLPKNS